MILTALQNLHLRRDRESKNIVINSKFDKLITSLTAVDNEGTLDKEATSYSDILTHTAQYCKIIIPPPLANKLIYLSKKLLSGEEQERDKIIQYVYFYNVKFQ
jgi:hypothetical protein